MNGSIVQVKKSPFAWIVIALLCLSILIEVLAAASLALNLPLSYYGTTSSLNALAAVALALDFVLSGVYLYKLFVFGSDVLPWTHIYFGYSVLRLTFAIFAAFASHKNTAYANIIELIIVCVVWMLFYLHLKRRVTSSPH
jgi:hypothetical protein